jgi:hypothetical protein
MFHDRVRERAMGQDRLEFRTRGRRRLAKSHAGRSRCIPEQDTAGLFHGREHTAPADRILSGECLKSRLVDHMEQRDMFGFPAGEGFEGLDSPL